MKILGIIISIIGFGLLASSDWRIAVGVGFLMWGLLLENTDY